MAPNEKNGVQYAHHDQPLCDYQLDEIRALSLRIPSEMGPLGCIIFPAKDDKRNVLVIFAGNLERFQMLSVARHARCKIIYFQDDQSYWYQGSDLLPSLPNLMPFLREEIGHCRPVFFGQSSGGYASLIAAGFIDNAVTISCSPQTGPDRDIKRAIAFGPTIQLQYAPDDLIDVRSHLIGKTEGKFIAAFASAAETANPIGGHMWCDWLHIGRIVGIENVFVHVAEAYRHSIVFRRAAYFSQLIADALQSNSPDELTQACHKCLNSLGEANAEEAWL